MDRLVDHYRNLGIQRILCLRGDQPSGSNQRTVFAKDLVEQLHQRFPDQFDLSVAAYPEIHPDSRVSEEDIHYFAAKVRAGADSAITQYFIHLMPTSTLWNAVQKQAFTYPFMRG